MLYQNKEIINCELHIVDVNEKCPSIESANVQESKKQNIKILNKCCMWYFEKYPLEVINTILLLFKRKRRIIIFDTNVSYNLVQLFLHLKNRFSISSRNISDFVLQCVTLKEPERYLSCYSIKNEVKSTLTITKSCTIKQLFQSTLPILHGRECSIFIIIHFIVFDRKEKNRLDSEN